MERYENIVKFWLKEFIEDGIDYSINTEVASKNVDIMIKIDKQHIGKLIGKNGNTITALRNLVNSISKKDKKNVRITVKEI